MGGYASAVALVLAMSAPAFAQQHAGCWLEQQGMLNQGVNPSDAEIQSTLMSLSVQNNVPFELMAATAYQESGIRQFESDGYLLHNTSECSGLFNGASSPNPPGLGMMQLTGSTASGFNMTLLRTDWSYNLQAGFQVMIGKFNAYKSSCPVWLATLNESNRNIIENWFMASWRYNGYVGNYGSYATTIFNEIKNRPGKLLNIIPAGLAPNTPSQVITHFNNSSLGEGYVVQPDGSWTCVHNQTFTGSVTITANGSGGGGGGGGGVPPPPTVASTRGPDRRCFSSAGGDVTAGPLALAISLLLLLRRR